MPLAISAHEAMIDASRTKDGDKAYEAVKAALNHAFSHIRVATERGHTRTMFTVMPEVHGFAPAHATGAAREVASALQRKGFRVTSVSARDLLIAWGKPQEPSRRGREPAQARIAPEDLWRFEPQ